MASALLALQRVPRSELRRVTAAEGGSAPAPGSRVAAAATLAARAADGVDAPWRSAADAVWHHGRVAGARAAAADLFSDLYSA